MSHYTMSYKGLSPVEADAKALADTRDYLGPKAWEALLFEVGRANGFDAAQGGHAGWDQILMALSFCGVQGYPVHAIGRCNGGWPAWSTAPVLSAWRKMPASC